MVMLTSTDQAPVGGGGTSRPCRDRADLGGVEVVGGAGAAAGTAADPTAEARVRRGGFQEGGCRLGIVGRTGTNSKMNSINFYEMKIC